MFRKSLRIMSLITACIMLTSIMASAASAAVATLISPKSKTLEGRIVDVTVSYDSESANVKIDTVVLYIDSKLYEKKRLDVPSQKGVVSFDWDTASYTRGQHLMEVKLLANNKIVTSVSGSGIVADQVFDNTAPRVKFCNIKDGEVVSGNKVIEISAVDDSGEPPIVSLLIDKKLKLMQNSAPYSYAMDTTALDDGEHYVDIYAFDNDGNQSEKVSCKFVVNNGGTALKAAAPANDSTVSVAAAPSVKTSSDTAAARQESAELMASVEAAGSSASAQLSAGIDGVFGQGNKAAAAAIAPADKASLKNIVSDSAAGAKLGTVKEMSPAVSAPSKKVAAAAAPVKSGLKSVAELKNIGVSQASSAKLMAKADFPALAVSAPVNLDVPVAAAEAAQPFKIAKADVSSKVMLATAARTNLVLPESGKAKIRDIVNQNGGVVLWDGKTKTVTAYINDVKVEMKIGSKIIKANGKSLTVNMIPKIQNGRTIIDVSDIRRAIDLAKESK